MDGNGSLFGTLQGNVKTVLSSFNVDLPKKHGRGGQSASRFDRLRKSSRHNYLRKVAETCTALFISNDLPNVKGIILAGSAEFKNNLQKSDLFDQRLLPIVMKIVDIAYGGELGFDQAIELSKETLGSVRFLEEKKVIEKFYEEIAKDSGKYIFGMKDTIEAMENGIIDTLIVWENLDCYRVTFKDAQEKTIVEYLTKNELPNGSRWRHPISKIDYDVIEQEAMIEYLIDNYAKHVSSLEIITNKTSEGNQFIKGFNGIGGILRYKIDQIFTDDDDSNTKDNDFNEDDFI